MSCPHCAHCHALAEAVRAELTLPDPPRPGGRDGLRLDWYERFAGAYRRARDITRTPAQALVAANDGRLSLEQVRRAADRARVLGLLERVREATPPPAPEPVDEAAPEPVDEGAGVRLHPGLEPMRDDGVPVTVRVVEMLTTRRGARAVQYLDELVAAGLAVRLDGDPGRVLLERRVADRHPATSNRPTSTPPS